MSTVTMKVDGLKELRRALLTLPPTLERKTLRQAVAAGARVVRDEMKQLAPVYTGSVADGHPPPGTLKLAVYMKQIPEQSSYGKQTYYVGVRHGPSRQHVGKKDRNLDAYYFFWVEFGTIKMAAKPYMRPAFDGKKLDALGAIKDTLSYGVRYAAQQVRW